MTPANFAAAVEQAIAALSEEEKHKYRKGPDEAKRLAGDELYQRLGWMPRVHPLVLPSGRWILPLYSDTFNASIMAISDDRGATWTASRPLIGFGNIQPSLVRKNDGVLVAFMRDNGPHRRIRLSQFERRRRLVVARDGFAFSQPRRGDRGDPAGEWSLGLIYNDLPRGRHSLAVSLSDDEGTTWKWTRHVEHSEPGKGQFHYPSIIQASDGSIHVTYTESRPGAGKHDRRTRDSTRPGSRPATRIEGATWLTHRCDRDWARTRTIPGSSWVCSGARLF